MKLMHIGKFLKEAYFEPSGLTMNKLSIESGVSQSQLSRIMSGKSDLTTEAAIGLSKVWPRKAESWLTHQARYKLQELQA